MENPTRNFEWVESGDSEGKMALKRDEPDDQIQALKELRRQWLAIGRRGSVDDLTDTFSESTLEREAADLIRKFISGELSPAEAQPELERLDESLEDFVQESGDPAIVMQHRAGKEAEAKELSRTAELLASDAQRRAADGISEEAWIDEVRNGYAGDKEAWLRCHEEIMTLREKGPWAWPRAGSDRAMGASSS